MRQCILEGRLGRLGSVFQGASPKTRQVMTHGQSVEARHSGAAGLIYVLGFGVFFFFIFTSDLEKVEHISGKRLLRAINT